MYYLIYVSAAARKLERKDLLDILDVSRRNNSAMGVTGILLFKDGSFMQLLEGEKAAVEEIFRRIEKDPRHRGIYRVHDGTADSRSFAGWSMGFREVTTRDLEGIPGFTFVGGGDFLSDAITENPSIALRIVKTFHDTNF